MKKNLALHLDKTTLRAPRRSLNMKEDQPAERKLRPAFLVNAMLLTLVLVAPIPFLTQFVKEIPLISLILGEVSLIFLIVLASFPKAGIKEIIKLGLQYLIFLSLAFSVLSFMPFAQKFKLFAFEMTNTAIPNSVAVNIVGLVLINVLVCILFAIELNRKAPVRRFKTKEERDMAKIAELETEQERSSFSNNLKAEVNSLFDLYLKDYESGEIESNRKLENIENVLLSNIDMNISGAVCVDKDGKMLHNTVFNWAGHAKDTIMDVFNRHNDISKKLGTGMLCQMIFQDREHWYIIAKFRGNYLILQTEEKDPAPLLETCYKVFRVL